MGVDPDGRRGAAEHLSDLGVGEILHIAQDEDLSLPLWQLPHRIPEGAVARVDRIRVGLRARRVTGKCLGLSGKAPCP